MFSPRLLAVFALVASAASLPATDRPAIPQPITIVNSEDVESPWFSFPLFGNLFAPLWQLFPKFTDIGPSIIADDEKFQVVVNVKGYKKDDLKVKVKGDFIFIQGSQEAKQDDRDVIASEFFHTYSLPANCSGSDVTASLSTDGYLVVKAPLDGSVDKSKAVDIVVSIEETGKPYKEDKRTEETPAEEKPTEEKAAEEKPVEEKPVEEKPVESKPVEDKVEKAPTTVAPTTAAPVEEDKKEPTTPAEAEEATEKDNVIPHGNEIQP